MFKPKNGVIRKSFGTLEKWQPNKERSFSINRQGQENFKD